MRENLSKNITKDAMSAEELKQWWSNLPTWLQFLIPLGGVGLLGTTLQNPPLGMTLLATLGILYNIFSPYLQNLSAAAGKGGNKNPIPEYQVNLIIQDLKKKGLYDQAVRTLSVLTGRSPEDIDRNMKDIVKKISDNIYIEKMSPYQAIQQVVGEQGGYLGLLSSYLTTHGVVGPAAKLTAGYYAYRIPKMLFNNPYAGLSKTEKLWYILNPWKRSTVGTPPISVQKAGWKPMQEWLGLSSKEAFPEELVAQLKYYGEPAIRKYKALEAQLGRRLQRLDLSGIVNQNKINERQLRALANELEELRNIRSRMSAIEKKIPKWYEHITGGSLPTERTGLQPGTIAKLEIPKWDLGKIKASPEQIRLLRNLSKELEGLTTRTMPGELLSRLSAVGAKRNWFRQFLSRVASKGILVPAALTLSGLYSWHKKRQAIMKNLSGELNKYLNQIIVKK